MPRPAASAIPGAGLVGRFLAMPNDSTVKTVVVATLLCLVCSVIVSTTAVYLKPLQERNKLVDRKRNILAVAGLLDPGKSVAEQFERIETRVVDLATGRYADLPDPAAYDQREAARDPARSIQIPDDRDIASIGHRAELATVYLVKDGERVSKYILPMHGYGLWSTMYGFLALGADATTVEGIRFYEHAETPGLGGEIDNPRWQERFRGKQALGPDGSARIEVIKGHVDPARPGAEYQVDGLAGATLTARGVTNMLRYWLGEHGFGPYLQRLRGQGS